MIGYSDSDYTGNVDNRRSVSGLLFTLCGCSISWTSRLQRCVSLSTTEAEFIAACESTKEAVWLRSLLTEILGVNNGSTPLLCDNEGAIRLVKNPEFHQRTKHIDTKSLHSRTTSGQGNRNRLHSNGKSCRPVYKTSPDTEIQSTQETNRCTSLVFFFVLNHDSIHSISV